MDALRDIKWWINLSTILIELHDRSQIIKLLFIFNSNSKTNQTIYYNYYDGRNGIQHLFGNLNEIVDYLFPGDVFLGMYKHYLFKYPRILPQYIPKVYPSFSFIYGSTKKNFNFFEKDFINCFIKDFNTFLEYLEKSIIFEFIDISLKRKTICRIEKLKERLEFLSNHI